MTRQIHAATSASLLIGLLIACHPVFAAPPLPSQPHGLPGDLGSFPAAGNQTSPAIARGGDQYLVVWTDDRTSLGDATGTSGSARDVYAARLAADGSLIDTTPIVIDQDEHDQYDPVVCWNGEAWLVLWTGTQPYGPLYTHLIQAVRVSPAGVVLDAEPLLIWDGGTTRGTSGEHLFGVASDGTDWALVIVDQYVQGLGTNLRLVGKRVTPDGTIVDAPYYLYSPSCCSFFFKGGLAYADGVYMAVFEGYVSGTVYGIFGLRLSPTLQTLDSYPVVLTQLSMQNETHYYRTPGVAGNGSEFYVGWQLYVNDVASQIYGARVTPAGVSLDGDGVPISGLEPLSLYLSPDVTWDGTQWVLGWPSSGQAMARVDDAGTVLDPGGVDLPQPYGALAATGSGGVRTVWSEARVADAMPEDVFSAPVADDLSVGTDACVALGAPSQTRAHLAAGASGKMLVFRSAISGQSRILAHPLDPGGQALLGGPVEIATGQVTDPRVAFADGVYLVVWVDETMGIVHGRRLAQDGTLLDAAAIELLDGTEPDVAALDDRFLVTAFAGPQARAVRVDTGGIVLDAAPLLLATAAAGGPRATRLGTYWLAAYVDPGSPDGGDIAAALVNAAGDVVGPVPISDTSDGYAAAAPAVAAGDTALVVWQDDRLGNDDLNLYGRRLTAGLSFLDPATGVPVVTAPDNQTRPAVTWDGVRFVTVFDDERNIVNTIDVRTDVYRNWIPTYGPVADKEGMSLYEDSVPDIDPAVVGQAGEALHAASVFSSVSPHTAYRIELRFAGLATDVGDDGDTPRVTRLLAPFPNPANPAVRIRFELARSGPVAVDVYDVLGRRIRRLAAQSLPAGQQELLWNGMDDQGRQVPSGTYLYRLRADGVEDAGKVAVVR